MFNRVAALQPGQFLFKRHRVASIRNITRESGIWLARLEDISEIIAR